MFKQIFVLGLFLMVATNPMCLLVLHIAIVDHMYVPHVHVERIPEWGKVYVEIREGLV